MSIKLKIEGFEELLHEIEKAGGNINTACETAMRQSAEVMQAELKSQMGASGVPSDLINEMPAPTLKSEGDYYSAKVGYKKGVYEPDDLSTGYKVVFMNYGTPRRASHGKMRRLGFIQKAKSKAKPQIKKQQEQAFKKILEGLKK